MEKLSSSNVKNIIQTGKLSLGNMRTLLNEVKEQDYGGVAGKIIETGIPSVAEMFGFLKNMPQKIGFLDRVYLQRSIIESAKVPLKRKLRLLKESSEACYLGDILVEQISWDETDVPTMHKYLKESGGSNALGSAMAKSGKLSVGQLQNLPEQCVEKGRIETVVATIETGLLSAEEMSIRLAACSDDEYESVGVAMIGTGKYSNGKMIAIKEGRPKSSPPNRFDIALVKTRRFSFKKMLEFLEESRDDERVAIAILETGKCSKGNMITVYKKKPCEEVSVRIFAKNPSVSKMFDMLAMAKKDSYVEETILGLIIKNVPWKKLSKATLLLYSSRSGNNPGIVAESVKTGKFTHSEMIELFKITGGHWSVEKAIINTLKGDTEIKEEK
jgi:hypothetical protein